MCAFWHAIFRGQGAPCGPLHYPDTIDSMKFADLGLSDELLLAVETAGYDTPTPIQAQAIPSVLMMKDIIGIAQTGTGKTASFVLPMIDVLSNGRRRALMPRSLILEPTRELAAQVAENFEKYGKNHDLKMALLIGGVQMGDQIKALNEGVDVLIATPGRLMDLFERGKILLTGCDLLVIDEADRMLDMGFIPDIEFICTKLPANRQTLLFSATMPAPIKKLADKFLTNPKTIEVARPATANINIAQHKVMVSSRKKRDVLRHLLRTDDVRSALIFANRKTTVRELAKTLKRDGFAVGEIHGDMDQSSRIAELQLFKDGKINVLCASDVAARGIDVKDVSHVFNFDTPWHPDDYIHRIGRTGRAGAKGRAFTFVAEDDGEAIANVEKLTGMKIPVFSLDGDNQSAAEAPAADAGDTADEAPKRDRRPRRGDDKRAAKPAAKKPVRAPEPEAEPVQEKRQEERPAAKAEPARSRAAKVETTRTEAARPKPASRKPAPKSAPDDDEDGGWNGPVPGFLGMSAD